MTTRIDTLYGSVAVGYVTRPHYPDELFSWLAEKAPARISAWDCGCGSGQASHDLARYFGHVTATDISEAQIKLATPSPRVTFRRAAAEISGLGDQSVDLINVGMAAHWFDLPLFYKEVLRVAKPQALLALMVYGEPITTNKEANIHLKCFSSLIDPYGPEHLRHVRTMYKTLPLPTDVGEELTLPQMHMESLMSLPQFLTYLQGRASVRDFISRENYDPAINLIAVLQEINGSPDLPMKIMWPLSGRVARIGRS